MEDRMFISAYKDCLATIDIELQGDVIPWPEWLDMRLDFAEQRGSIMA
jgi:hypothetical protein